MKILDNPIKSIWPALIKRPAYNYETLDNIVREVFLGVKKNGDNAIKNYTLKFDKVSISNFKVNESEFVKAEKEVSDQLKDAINLAKRNIEIFHRSQIIEKKIIKTSDGVNCWQESRGIDKVGIYIPGGSAPLFSTVLMLGVPARIAGCKEIVLCTPPDNQGNIHPAILYTAKLLGIKKVYKIGGIQAIGALTYGTESVPKVYKIFGPGNQYVTAAKQYAMAQGIAIDMPAGPSELMVVADDTAVASYVASDLLSQAEHGGDSQVICVSKSLQFLEQVLLEVGKQLEVLPRRDIAKVAIKNSKLIYLKEDLNILDLINEYAAEHLIIAVENEEFYLKNISNAGSVFIGNYTPESAGDYASGTNHTLPTNGFARAYSGVNLDAFVKKITFQKINKKGILNIGNAIELMAEEEGLHAHRNAISLRLKDLI